MKPKNIDLTLKIKNYKAGRFLKLYASEEIGESNSTFIPLGLRLCINNLDGCSNFGATYFNQLFTQTSLPP